MSTELDFTSPKDIAQFFRSDDESWLRVNMILSLDGSHIGPTGSSRDLSSPTDLLVLLTLRALSDVVLVGAKTALAEKYRYHQIRPELKSIAEKNPPFALVSDSLDLPLTAPIFAAEGPQPHVITREQQNFNWQRNFERLKSVAQISIISCETLTGELIRNELASLGFSRITCEGGPTLLTTLFAAAVVDELCLTTSPVITGNLSPAMGLGQEFVTLSPVAQHLENGFQFTRFRCT
ncbi:MAG: dihydrofolate reductase family protein [Actinomycetales bacterium]|nr:dihydrofolate reductase family protein [Actinomycetales bacterium]